MCPSVHATNLQRLHLSKRAILYGTDGIAHQVELFQMAEPIEGVLSHRCDVVVLKTEAAEGRQAFKRSVHVLDSPRDVIVAQLAES